MCLSNGTTIPILSLPVARNHLLKYERLRKTWWENKLHNTLPGEMIASTWVKMNFSAFMLRVRCREDVKYSSAVTERPNLREDKTSMF